MLVLEQPPGIITKTYINQLTLKSILWLIKHLMNGFYKHSFYPLHIFVEKSNDDTI